ncbi:hypothetical protein GCM10027048_34210 [Hymenobacter coalescens]
MRKLYRFGLMVGLVVQAGAAQAQIALSSFDPNTQDFNTLTASTGPAAYTNNVTLPGLYLGSNVYFQNSPTFPFPSGFYDYTPDRVAANDGSVTTAQFYSLGSSGSPDRAIGGLATGQSGTGYAGLRYKNTTGATIRNLAVTYTMEQWYNSGTIDQANFQVHYRTGAANVAVNSIYDASGTWTPVSQLNVFAPSTTKPITNQNGNVASNRVTVSYTILNVNLANNAEIMLRWKYSLDNSTNGNGLGVDDVTVTPESNIFYSKTTGNLNNPNSWGANPDGTGTAPANFTTNNQIFYVRGVALGNNRLGGSTWTVSGSNSKIVVGQDGEPAKLLVASNADIDATIDVATGSTLRLEKAGSGTLKLGNLNVGSTVEYTSTTDAHTILPKQYSRLRVIGAGAKNLGGHVTVTDTLSFRSNADVSLGTYDLTLSSVGAMVGTSPNSFVVTNGRGKLRLPVAGTNGQNQSQAVLFPVGTSSASYTPIGIKQNTAQSQDIFEVRVIDNVYLRYDAQENPVGAPITSEVVKKTWFVSKETPTIPNVDVQMQMEWNATDAAPDFATNRAFVGHHTGGRWDQVSTRPGATQPRAGAFSVVRTGITSFSPFGVSSSVSGVLPVELLAFGARCTGAVVSATWATAQEQDNAYFDVQRSRDGHVFNTIGRVEGSGTSTQRRDYQFVDQQPVKQPAYYRLRQVDVDGTESFSQIVVVAPCSQRPAAMSLTVAPNPGSDLFEVWSGVAPGTVLHISVVSATGVPVLRARVTAGATRPVLDLRAQPAGVYIVQVSTPTGVETTRVVKQ